MSRRGAWLVSGVLGMGLLVAGPGSAPPAGAQVGSVADAGGSALAAAVGEVDYIRVDLGTLGGDTSGARAVNERGQVVGSAQTTSIWFGSVLASHAYLWDPVTGMSDLGTLGGDTSEAVALNDRGQVAGSAETASGARHAFLWDPATGMTDLGTLGGEYSRAVAINEQGQIAGTSANASEEGRAFLWDPVAGMTDLGTLGGTWSEAVDLNDRGEVAGVAGTASGGGHAFLWDPTEGMRDLLGFQAVDVNDRGQVAGWVSSEPDQRHAFLWDPVTGMTELAPFGEDWSEAVGVNELGQLAGWVSSGSGDRRAFLWDPETGTTDLGTFGWDDDGDLGYAPTAVNDVGQVAGYGFRGVKRVFLWDPVAGMTSLGKGSALDVNDNGQIAGYQGAPRATLWTPSELAPQVRVRVARAGYGNRLRVNVDPNRAGDSWTFRVQKRTDGAWRTLPGVYRTRGTADTRTLTLGPGRFRVKVQDQYGYRGTASPMVRLTRPTVKVLASANATRSTLRVDVDPNRGSGCWTFRVLRKRADGTWRTLPKVYRTRGSAETRTVDLRRGEYRVRVLAAHHYRGATSGVVVLTR